MVSSHYISPYDVSLQVSQADTVLDHQNHEKLEQYDSFSLYTVYMWWTDIFANVRGFIRLKTTWLLQYLLQTKRTSVHFPLHYIIIIINNNNLIGCCHVGRYWLAATERQVPPTLRLSMAGASCCQLPIFYLNPCWHLLSICTASTETADGPIHYHYRGYSENDWYRFIQSYNKYPWNNFVLGKC